MIFFDEDNGLNPPVAAPQAPVTPVSKDDEPVSMTNKQMNDIIAKNAAKEAAKMLKDAGIEPTGDLKKDVEAFKAWKESTMSETEKLKAQLAERDAKDGEERKASEAVRAENAALKKGVPADKVDRVVKLSAGYEGETVEDRVSAVLADFPEFAKSGVKDIGAPAKGQGIDEDTAMLTKLEEMRKRK